MVLMNTTTNSLTNIMATGNKIVILCDDDNSKMFPFVNDEKCLLPIGNSSNLSHLLKICQNYSKDILVIAKETPKILGEIKDYPTTFQALQTNPLKQIYEYAKHDNQCIVIHGECVIDKEDMRNFFLTCETNRNVIMVKKFNDQGQSIDSIGANVQETIQAIIPHARAHYVNAFTCGVFSLGQESIHYLPYTANGFHHINCGTMPDKKFYIEECIQNAIENNQIFIPSWNQFSYDFLRFPWDIRSANDHYCINTIAKITENNIHQTTIIDEHCLLLGKLVTGKNCTIKEGVIIEGNCVLGDDVVIEKNVMIGRNCAIGSGSTIKYACRINDHTIIGKKNKIGFSAEISGVTFEGVAAVHNCEVFGVIGRNVDIAAGVQMAVLKFDDTMTIQKIKGKRYANSYTNSIFLGDYTRTGINNIFYPGVKIGMKCALGPGLIINKDIQANQLVMPIQEVQLKEWGSHRYGW